ncbi:MAG: ATP-binding domain-containing protein, partial [Turicibacter sp.]|nr:ATP-binding domain-containing protein [Turicibacter sp.]
AQKFRNICVVGDSDQSIYSWRGANIENILSFENDYPDENVVLLEKNYRSKQMILNAANDVIKNNSGRLDKKLWSDRGEGEAIEYYRAQEGDIEANYIADKIAYMRRDTYDYHDFAVLYRTNSQSRTIEQALLRQNIPYRLVGGQSYFKRKEIKDLMAYLRLICNPDDDLSFVRVVNEPKRGIGAASVDKLAQFALESELSLMASIQDATGVVAKATLNKLMDFKTMIYMLRAQIEDHSLGSFIDLVLSQTGYLEMLENENTIEADSRIDNLGEFKSMATQFEEVNLDEILKEEESEETADDLSTMTKLIILLNDLMLQTDTETEEEANESKVTLMTIHAAKGLEFPVVFICGFEDGIFPLRSAIEQGADDLEEERRLAYVAITRAEDLLFITNAQSRYQYGMRSANPESMFIREISDSYLNKTGIESRPRPSFTLQEAMESKAPKRQIKTVSLNSDSSWNSGDKVHHDTFGEGVVVGVKGEVISIAFGAPHGIKKLMGSHPALKKRS